MKKQKIEEQKINTECKDKDCPRHGNLKLRGRTFKGTVVSKYDKRIAIEFERMVYVRKYERYARKKTKVHARLPRCLEKDVNIGDLVRVKECRPLSKIIHFAFLEKVKEGVNTKK
ncbi:MAG: 30S ribosomal protein S17 [Nanoarchaeota archaeon]|nr:30S ribosomal protein S17 [Nanoarchaeota archaeon]